jgi:long-chain acyl-CoA synthetase
MDANFWHGKRPPGVADEIPLDKYQAAVEVLEQAVKEHAGKPAFTNAGHTLTFSDIDQLAAHFASYIQHHTDLKPGDRIAIQLPNTLQYPVAVLGALRAGLVLVNTNPLYTEREMLHQFDDSGAKALLFIDMFGNKVQRIAEQTGIKYFFVTSLADLLPAPKRWVINAATKYIKKMVPDYSLPGQIPLRKALSIGAKQPFKKLASPKWDDVAVLQYTGGTTGVAKGAMLTNGNLIANMEQARAAIKQTDSKGRPLYEPGTEVVVAPLPLYHIYAFTVHMMGLFAAGEHSILIANPRDPGMFIRMMKPWRITAMTGINTLFVSLLDHPAFKTLDLSSMKFTLSGGSALPADTAVRWQKATGCAISEGYGLTECSPIISVNGAGDTARIGTVGVPVPNTLIKLIDDSGNEVALGERGELCVKGPQVMKGYWNRPEETANVFTADGWLRTGDVAVIDPDGHIRIVDRIKDLILVSGFNVYPNEIENVVSSHPAVQTCACIGVPDAKTGESPKLFIIPKHDNVTKDEIMAYCRENLTAYKLPRQIEFRTELPMTPVGKVLRRELRDAELKKAS